MKPNFHLVCYTVIIAAVVIVFFSPHSNQSGIRRHSEIPVSPFFEPRFFYPAINYAKSSHLVFSRPPVIIILPHDQTASYITADLLSKAAKFRYEHVYLIGPNHSESGSKKLISASTPDGKNIVYSDHSIGNPLLYISYFFPNVRISSFVIKNQISKTDLETWSDEFAQSPVATLYIFSIDFSHYLSANSASEKDRTTYNLIASGNTPELLQLNNDHTDSPSALALAVDLAKRLHADKLLPLHNTNSGLLLNDFASPVTSYFGLAFFN